jgi:hypothetical protein
VPLRQLVLVQQHDLSVEDGGDWRPVPADGTVQGKAGNRGAAVNLVALTLEGAGVVNVGALLSGGGVVGLLEEPEHLGVELGAERLQVSCEVLGVFVLGVEVVEDLQWEERRVRSEATSKGGVY